ncbi:MAG: MATE family efflux transporter [Clostridia bacterium]|nr:MATE family efflux transporter [Clostridia bacterium]
MMGLISKNGQRLDKVQNSEMNKHILKISIPIALQSIIMMTLNMTDQIMVGQLGESSIAAVGISNRVITILTVILSGLASGIGIYTAQFWGKKDKEKIGQLLGLGLSVGGVLTVVFVLAAILAPKACVGIFTTDPEVISNGVKFLRIVAYSYIPTTLTIVYSSILRSTAHVKIPMAASMAAVVCNVILNYVFIFGKFGFPELGIEGAAVATTISRIIELIIIISSIYILKLPGAVSIKNMRGMSKSLVNSFVKTTYPILLTEMLWVFGETMYNLIYGRIGTSEYTAMAITFPIQGLAVGVLSGLSCAAGVIIGNAIGANEEDKAIVYAKKIVKLGITFAAVSGAIVILISRFYIKVYNISSEAEVYAQYLLIVFSFFLWVKVSNMIIAGGILSSGGDSKYVFAMESTATWIVGVPSGLIAAFVLDLPVHWVYLLLSLEEVVRLVFGLRRMFSGKWVNNLVSQIN